MTSLLLQCPTCDHTERLDFRAEDTYMSLGPEISPGVFAMKETEEMSVFDAARAGWDLLEIANARIERMAEEYERVLLGFEETRYRTAARPEHSHGPFVASVRRRHFHRPECIWAEQFVGGRACEVFGTHEEAVASGKKPCKTCCA
jgi:hypothetical protein